jgi:hypothetical protein
MKDQLRSDTFWEKNIKVSDGNLISTLKDFALSRKNDIKNIGFDYRNNVFSRSLSKTIMQDPKRDGLISAFEVLINYLIDSVKYIKKHNNFAISKKWRDFN